MWYWRKKRQVDQWNRSDSSGTDLHKYSQLIFDKGAKATQWNKDSPSTNGTGKTGHPHAKKEKSLDTDLIPFMKINSKWIIDLNIKHKLQNC